MCAPHTIETTPVLTDPEKAAHEKAKSAANIVLDSGNANGLLAVIPSWKGGIPKLQGHAHRTLHIEDAIRNALDKARKIAQCIAPAEVKSVEAIRLSGGGWGGIFTITIL